jgi:glycosyltransferase involved in cell wall biosynthesis
VVAYRQAAYIREAVQAAFAQTYRPLQIILSDDDSPDETYAILRRAADEYATDDVDLVVNRTERQGGLGPHLNEVAQLMRGDLMVYSSGDDYSIPERCERVFEAWDAGGRKAAALHSSHIRYSADRRDLAVVPIDMTRHYTVEQTARSHSHILGAAAAWRRDVFDEFPPLLPSIRAEDSVLLFRALLVGTVCGIIEPLVKWRIHADSLHHSIEAGGHGEISALQWDAERTRRKLALSRQNRVDVAAHRPQARKLRALIDRKIAENEWKLRIFGFPDPEPASRPRDLLLGVPWTSTLKSLLKRAASPVYDWLIRKKLERRRRRLF